MARASLISQARGERVHSTGTHRRLDVMPTPEKNAGRISWDERRVDSDNTLAFIDSIMRNNRAAVL